MPSDLCPAVHARGCAPAGFGREGGGDPSRPPSPSPVGPGLAPDARSVRLPRLRLARLTGGCLCRTPASPAQPRGAALFVPSAVSLRGRGLPLRLACLSVSAFPHRRGGCHIAPPFLRGLLSRLLYLGSERGKRERLPSALGLCGFARSARCRSISSLMRGGITRPLS